MKIKLQQFLIGLVFISLIITVLYLLAEVSLYIYNTYGVGLSLITLFASILVFILLLGWIGGVMSNWIWTEEESDT